MNIQEINKSRSPSEVAAYLAERLNATVERTGKEFKITGQGGLFVDDSGHINKPGEGKGAGSFGILGAMIYLETGGRWTATGPEFRDILSKTADLVGYVDDAPPPAQRQKSKPPVNFDAPTKIYSYTDEDGTELYQNCRYEWITDDGKREKTFRQRRKNGDSWVYNLNGTRRVPYRLLDLLKEPDTFCDTEGEKDADTLTEMGLTAVNIGKDAKAWEAFATYAKDKTVIVFADNDKPGKASALERTRFWYKAGASVKQVCFEDMPEKSDVTDWHQSNTTAHDVFALQEIIQKTPQYHPLSDLVIDFFHVPSNRPPVVSIDGRHFVAAGELAGIVASIGTGKSHLLEIFAALAVNPDCEPHSKIDMGINPGEKAILIDTERTADDCFYGLHRMWRRTGQHPHLLTSDKRQFRQFMFCTASHLPKVERRERLLDAIETPGLKMLLIDGLLDFIINPNDPLECNEFVVWLHQQANKQNIAIIYSIQGNRNDVSGKGKGWAGAEVQAKSASYLQLTRHPKNPRIRLLTSGFENKKVRHGDDTDLVVAMQFDEDLRAFRCIEYDPLTGEAPSQNEIIVWCFTQAKKDVLSKKELTQIYMGLAGCAQKTAYRHIDKAVGESIEIIQDGKNSLYRLLNIF